MRLICIDFRNPFFFHKLPGRIFPSSSPQTDLICTRFSFRGSSVKVLLLKSDEAMLKKSKRNDVPRFSNQFSSKDVGGIASSHIPIYKFVPERKQLIFVFTVSFLKLETWKAEVGTFFRSCPIFFVSNASSSKNIEFWYSFHFIKPLYASYFNCRCFRWKPDTSTLPKAAYLYDLFWYSESLFLKTTPQLLPSGSQLNIFCEQKFIFWILGFFPCNKNQKVGIAQNFRFLWCFFIFKLIFYQNYQMDVICQGSNWHFSTCKLLQKVFWVCFFCIGDVTDQRFWKLLLISISPKFQTNFSVSLAAGFPSSRSQLKVFFLWKVTRWRFWGKFSFH